MGSVRRRVEILQVEILQIMFFFFVLIITYLEQVVSI